MDLRLYLRVLWRFRILLAFGLVLAMALSLLSVVRVRFEGGSFSFSYREQEEWVSYSRLFVTQRGFPWGQLTIPEGSGAVAGAAPEEAAQTAAGGVVGQSSTPVADPARLTTLAILYSHLALSDQVRGIILEDGPIEGSLEAAPVTTSQSSKGDALPIISIAALAPTPQGAVDLARRETNAFREYVSRQQVANRIPESNRVVLTVVKRPVQAELYRARSRTRSVVVLTTVLLGIIGLAFVLENLRPRIGPVRKETRWDEEPVAEDARSSA